MLSAYNFLGERYGVCKENCFAKNETLREAVKKDDEKKYTITFSSNDPCLIKCRKVMRTSMDKLYIYYKNRSGFYIESTHKYI